MKDPLIPKRKVKHKILIPRVHEKDIGCSKSLGNLPLFKTSDGRVFEIFIGSCQGDIRHVLLQEVIFKAEGYKA